MRIHSSQSVRVQGTHGGEARDLTCTSDGALETVVIDVFQPLGVDIWQLHRHEDATLYHLFATWREMRRAISTGGMYIISFDVVPSDQFWYVDRVVARDDTSAPSVIRVRVSGGDTDTPFGDVISPLVARNYYFDGPAVLGPGDFLQLVFMGTVSGDSLYAFVMGRKMYRQVGA